MGLLPHPMNPFWHPIEANGFSPRLGRPLDCDGVRGADGVCSGVVDEDVLRGIEFDRGGARACGDRECERRDGAASGGQQQQERDGDDQGQLGSRGAADGVA